MEGPTKNPIVFIHGDLQNHTLFHKISDYFEAKGHQVVNLDLPGHGANPFSENKRDISKHFIGELERRMIRMPIIVSFSSGSAVTGKMIEDGYNVAALVLINPLLATPAVVSPNLNFDLLRKSYMEKARELFKEQRLVNYREQLEGDPKEAGFTATDPNGLENMFDFYTSIPEFTKLYNLDSPILFISSTKDPFIAAEIYASQFNRMSKAKREEIAEAGHHLMYSHQNEIVSIIDRNYKFISDS